MGQNRIGAAGKDSGHSVSVDRKQPVADRENALMDPVQSTGRGAFVDRAHAEADLDKLAQRHDPMLLGGKPSYPPIPVLRPRSRPQDSPPMGLRPTV